MGDLLEKVEDGLENSSQRTDWRTLRGGRIRELFTEGMTPNLGIHAAIFFSSMFSICLCFVFSLYMF